MPQLQNARFGMFTCTPPQAGDELILCLRDDVTTIPLNRTAIVMGPARPTTTALVAAARALRPRRLRGARDAREAETARAPAAARRGPVHRGRKTVGAAVAAV